MVCLRSKQLLMGILCGCLLTKWQNYFREINQQFQGILKIFIQKKNLCRKQLLHILQQFKMKETGR